MFSLLEGNRCATSIFVEISLVFGASKALIEKNDVVVSNISCFHPYLGKISNLTKIFQRGWFNHQLENL